MTQLVRFAAGAHDPNCSGCPCCSLEMVDILEHATYSRAPSPRTAQERKTASEWRDHFGKLLRGYGSVVTENPDPYAGAINRRPHSAEPGDTPGYDPFGQPADPYAAALSRRKNR